MTKTEQVEVREKALFSQRLIAIIIDIFLVLFVANLIMMPFPNKNMEKLQLQQDEVIEQFTDGKIDVSTYFLNSMEIAHDKSKESAVGTLLTIALNIVYFVLFQFYNNGQTLGKKLLRIRVESNDKKEKLTMNQIIIRAVLINSILLDMILLTYTLIIPREQYIIGYLILFGISTIISLGCMISAIIRDDGRGLHDLVANTVVLRDEVFIKEEKTCES